MEGVYFEIEGGTTYSSMKMVVKVVKVYTLGSPNNLELVAISALVSG